MSDRLRLALVQADFPVGAVEDNLRRILSLHAQASDADLLVLPEAALSGYPLQDLVLRPGFVARVGAALEALAARVRGSSTSVLVGLPVPGPGLPHNAAVLLRPDGTRAVVGKQELPNSDVFDEVRHFAPAPPSVPLEVGGVRLGVLICEDMWHPAPAARLAGSGAEMLLVLNGSPFEVGKARRRVALARERIRETGLPLAYLNLCGAQDEIVFDGASFVLSTADTAPWRAAAFAEHVMRLDVARGVDGLVLSPLGPEAAAWPEGDAARWLACVSGLRGYVRKNGFREVLLGLSGGIDSAAVAAMAVDALGAAAVRTVSLPSALTLRDGLSVPLAEAQAARLGIRLADMPIAGGVDALSAALGPDVAAPGSALTRQNLQARVRGVLLMGLSNLTGALLLTTGNKTEMAVGYATLYGDMCGGYNPLKDLWKTEVFAACRWRNALPAAEAAAFGLLGPEAPVLDEILARPPTAELEAGQTDEADLGPYPEIDAVLRALVEDLREPDDAAARASAALGRPVDPARAHRLAALVRRAEWKRRQAAPGPKVGPRNFGLGWRMPITAGVAPVWP